MKKIEGGNFVKMSQAKKAVVLAKDVLRYLKEERFVIDVRGEVATRNAGVILLDICVALFWASCSRDSSLLLSFMADFSGDSWASHLLYSNVREALGNTIGNDTVRSISSDKRDPLLVLNDIVKYGGTLKQSSTTGKRSADCSSGCSSGASVSSGSSASYDSSSNDVDSLRSDYEGADGGGSPFDGRGPTGF